MKGVWARVNPEEIYEAGFDTEINYNWRYRSDADKAKTLEEGARYGIKIIPVLYQYFKDNDIAGAVALVRKWRDNPNIGGWLLEDEPQLRRISVANQRNCYNRIKEVDSVNPLYTVFMADGMKSEYYSPDTFDVGMADYYPVRPDYNWRELLERNILRWISSTGNRDIISAIQGHYLPSAGLSSPVGTIQGQYDIWKSHGLVARGYTIYEWFTSGGDGLAEDPRVLAEVTVFNGGTAPPRYPCPYCPATFTSQAELDAHIAKEHGAPLYPCPYCPATFTSQAELDAHIAREHPSNGEIDVGESCTDRPNEGKFNGTFINTGNPANATGKLTNICIYNYATGGENYTVGIFYKTNGNTLKCRSAASLGVLGAGKHNIRVNLNVSAGDYIGVYSREARCEYSISGASGRWYGAGVNGCVVNDERTYVWDSGRGISLYGSGLTDIVEVITTQTTRHTCNALIEYKVSSIAENNDTLSCSHCGLSLGVKGIKGSAQVIEEPEVVTPHIVICQGCGSKLELSISSIANKNFQQYCPVCGKAAD